MTQWKDLTVDASSAATTARILAALTTNLPGWLPNEGTVEVALAEEFALEEYNLQQQMLAFSQDIVAAGLSTVWAAVTPIVANPATLTGVTLALLLPPSAGDGVNPFTQTVAINTGFTISAGGQQFTLLADATALVTFTVLASGPNAGSYGGTMTVNLTAVTAGSAGNIAATTTATVISSTGLVSGATLTVAASGGTDAETTQQFLTRFIAWASTLRPGGVTTADIVALAITVSGVQRALALDMYDPAAPTVPAEKTSTWIGVDATGAVLSSAVKTAVSNVLAASREVNFVFHNIDPTYTNIALNVTVTHDGSHTIPAVQAAVTTALTALISPATWGVVGGDLTTWTDRTTLTALDVASALGKVAGIASIGAITVNGSTTSATLTGPGALPSPLGASGSSITVTVN